MGCRHEFIGHAEGVKCSLCGLEMTTEEYREYLKGGKAEKVEAPAEVAPKEVKTEPKKPTAKKPVSKKK